MLCYNAWLGIKYVQYKLGRRIKLLWSQMVCRMKKSFYLHEKIDVPKVENQNDDFPKYYWWN